VPAPDDNDDDDDDDDDDDGGGDDEGNKGVHTGNQFAPASRVKVYNVYMM